MDGAVRALTRPPPDVWAALTGGSTPHVGEEALVAVRNGYVAAGVLTVVDPPAVLEYEWRLDGRPAGRVRRELVGGPGGARLVLAQSLTSWAMAHRAPLLAAWHTHLEVLADHLRGVTGCPWPAERTEELRRHYAARVG